MTSVPLSAPAPAATAVLLRDGGEGLEVLLVQRGSQLAFHGGAWVFPGGRVESSDFVEPDPRSAAARAAVRETLEEASVSLDAGALVPLSHWTTPHGMPRRFATWFFAAQVERDAEVRVDGGEIHAYRWLAPAAALRLQAEGALELPPPTFVTLTSLTCHGCAGSVLHTLRESTPSVFVPRPRPSPQGIVSLYEGDAAYEGAELEALGPRHRLCMFPRAWRYELTR